MQGQIHNLDDQPKFLGHPVGLYVCALTEMWERFSFYGMKFLLVLYLTKYHLFTDGEGLNVLGNYASLVYALPLIGGMLADRYLGMRKAVIFGGIMLCLGHLGMAYEGTQAVTDASGAITRDTHAIQIFYLSLSLIIVGVGFLKPNISTIVGRLYKPEDPHRDSGFTIFYMGINSGSALATLTCGYLGETYGWRYGFGLAGIGMILGLIVFTFGQKYLYGQAEPADPKVLEEKVVGIKREHLIYLGSILSLSVLWFLVQNHTIVMGMLAGSSFAFLIFLAWFLTKCNPVERARMIVLTMLIVFSVVFWFLFEQAGGSMTLYADRVMIRPAGVTASQFGSLNAIFIILFAPIFAWLWLVLAKKNLEPSTPVKFALGIVLAGAGFGVLVLGAKLTAAGVKVHWIYMCLAYLLHSCGELCLSPVGLSAVTKLSVPKVVGVMMGAWFLGTAASEFIAAQLSKVAAIDPNITDLAVALQPYNKLFGMLFWIGLASGIVVLFLAPWMRKNMHGIH